jgi:chromosome segregation ATPase
MITKEAIEQRLAQLKVEAEQVQAHIVQLQANLNAYQGAIQDCEHWLALLAAQAPQGTDDDKLR